MLNRGEEGGVAALQRRSTLSALPLYLHVVSLVGMERGYQQMEQRRQRL